MDAITEALKSFPLVAFVAACLAVGGIMTTLKRLTRAWFPGAVETARMKSVMAVSNLLWGVVVALAAFPGVSLSMRAIWGLAVGGVWKVVYDAAIKRFGGSGSAPASDAAGNPPASDPPFFDEISTTPTGSDLKGP